VASLFVATSFADPTLLQQKGKPLAELIATDASLIREQRMGMVRQMPEGRLRQSLLAMSEGQSAENLKARVVGIAMATPVPAPTLAQSRIVVIDCEDDPVIPEVLRQGVRERYPNAAHYRLQSGGHFPALLNPAELNPILRRHSF
jgi:pimeloyl-ACP methyl ester carboxylesterase